MGSAVLCSSPIGLHCCDCRWAREALRVLFALIALGGEVPAGRRWHKALSALDPPWLESEMRHGMPDGQELPEQGEFRAKTCDCLKPLGPLWSTGGSFDSHNPVISGTRCTTLIVLHIHLVAGQPKYLASSIMCTMPGQWQ